jgi:hypothetical protein
LLLAFPDQIQLKIATTITRQIQINLAVNTTNHFAAFAISRIARDAPRSLLLTVTQMLLQLGIQGAFCDTCGELL